MIDAARLRSLPLFGDLDEYDLSQVARWVVEVQAAPGELLIEQGSMPYLTRQMSALLRLSRIGREDLDRVDGWS